MSQLPLPQWQDRARDARFSDPAYCAERAGDFERTIRRRNLLEYAAGAFVALLFGASSIGAAIHGQWGIAVSMFVSVIGIGLVLWALFRRASNLVRRPEEPCLVHLRRQYQHQHRALSTAPLWYLGPLVPGILLLFGFVTWNVAQVAGWERAVIGVMQPAGIVFGIFALIALANWLAARGLKRRIEELDALA